ncbi:MAG TPA: metallophosphoesterase [Dongiaceae bacterium]|jgi:3',5'-cyclic AMP phosphodiesterase CpdA|nr:metallophosphoesterase [Dongiaceae bacterium]
MKPQSARRERAERRRSFALAHLSDPHLAGWSVDRPWSLANKRLKGWLSWQHHGSRIHLAHVLELMLDDIRKQALDHIVVTGDLVNIALPQEFENAARWLHRLGPSDRVTVIPGNHDAYVSVPQAEGIARWRDYMTDLGWNGPDGAATIDSFPFVRRVGPLALVGLTTAVPMPLFVGAGRLGTAQLDVLRDTLTQLEATGACRVVLIHHPPYAYGRRGLLDVRQFVDVVREAGAELILHGHTHVAGLRWIGKTPVIGVPSASALRHGDKDAAAYNLYRISCAEQAWKIAVEVREMSDDLGHLVWTKSFDLIIPAMTEMALKPSISDGLRLASVK